MRSCNESKLKKIFDILGKFVNSFASQTNMDEKYILYTSIASEF